MKPGITDCSSIVFSNEAEVVGDHLDPDYAYDNVIRPLKSRLGLIYIENQSIKLELKLLLFTLLTVIDRKLGLALVRNTLETLGYKKEARAISGFGNRLN